MFYAWVIIVNDNIVQIMINCCLCINRSCSLWEVRIRLSDYGLLKFHDDALAS